MLPHLNPSHAISLRMFSTYSLFSFVGLVSSNRRLHTPLYFSAIPKSMQMALACPMCRYPLGSGGNRVCMRPPFLPSARSCSTSCSTKLRLFFSSIGFSSVTDIIYCFFLFYTYYYYSSFSRVLTLVFKCSPFGLQKESFYSPKGVLLGIKRGPFASQKGYICRAMPFGWPKHSIYYVQS